MRPCYYLDRILGTIWIVSFYRFKYCTPHPKDPAVTEAHLITAAVADPASTSTTFGGGMTRMSRIQRIVGEELWRRLKWGVHLKRVRKKQSKEVGRAPYARTLCGAKYRKKF
jgi:hypothetical protein